MAIQKKCGTTTYFEENKLKAEYEKYWDKYEVDEEEKTETSWENDNEKIKELAEKRLNLMKDVKGVGMYDVKNTFSFYGKANGSWNWITDVQGTNTQYGVGIYNNDSILVGNISRPFLLRGGGWRNSSVAGVFASYGFGGGAVDSQRFPPSASCALSKQKNRREAPFRSKMERLRHPFFFCSVFGDGGKKQAKT